MPRVSPMLSRSDSGKGPQVDLRQTVCKVCRHAICVGEAREWSHRPMGLVHDYCVGETG